MDTLQWNFSAVRSCPLKNKRGWRIFNNEKKEKKLFKCGDVKLHKNLT